MIEELKEFAIKSPTYKEFHQALFRFPHRKMREVLLENGYANLIEFYLAHHIKEIYLTPEETAKILNITEQELTYFRIVGGGPGYQQFYDGVHHCVKYKYEDVIEYLEKNKTNE